MHAVVLVLIIIVVLAVLSLAAADAIRDLIAALKDDTPHDLR